MFNPGLDPIREFRLRRGWTQQQFAEALGIKQQRVSLLENGLRPSPKEKQLIREILARSYGDD